MQRIHLNNPDILEDPSVWQAVLDAAQSQPGESGLITFSLGNPDWNPDDPTEFRKFLRLMDVENDAICANPDCEVTKRKMKMCDRCHRVHYCGKECQIKHWAIHKKECKQVSNTPLAGTADDARAVKDVLSKITAANKELESLTQDEDANSIGLASLCI